MTEKLTQSMENAVSNMNWGQVYFFMTQFEWTWASIGGVPTIPQLKESAWDLFDSLVEENEYRSVSSSGLVVSKQDGGIEIKFVAVSVLGFPDST